MGRLSVWAGESKYNSTRMTRIKRISKIKIRFDPHSSVSSVCYSFLVFRVVPYVSLHPRAVDRRGRRPEGQNFIKDNLRKILLQESMTFLFVYITRET